MELDPYILIVEDDTATRDAMALVLQMEGYRVALAENGQEALDYLHHHPPPCVILLDLLTPVMDGWEFRRRQQKDPALAGIPVIVISGAENAKEQAASFGAAGYILKPIDAEPLLATVQLFASKQKPEILVAENKPAVGNLVVSALRLHGFVVHQAASASQAIELYRQHQDRIGLVLMDAALGAPDTLAALRAINPEIRCCLMNQQASPYSAEQLSAMGASHVITHPFPSLADAAHMLRELGCRT